MPDNSKPDLLSVVLEIAEERDSPIPPEMLSRLVNELNATQFDDDRQHTMQFVRDMAEEYLVEHSDLHTGGNR